MRITIGHFEAVRALLMSECAAWLADRSVAESIEARASEATGEHAEGLAQAMIEAVLSAVRLALDFVTAADLRRDVRQHSFAKKARAEVFGVELFPYEWEEEKRAAARAQLIARGAEPAEGAGACELCGDAVGTNERPACYRYLGGAGLWHLEESPEEGAVELHTFCEAHAPLGEEDPVEMKDEDLASRARKLGLSIDVVPGGDAPALYRFLPDPPGAFAEALGSGRGPREAGAWLRGFEAATNNLDALRPAQGGPG